MPSVPAASFGTEDELMCSPVVLSHSEAPLLSKGVEWFKFCSERNNDSDEEEDAMGAEIEDRADALNSLLVLEEREEGIRRYRSSVDDTDRIAHCESAAREQVIPFLLEAEDTEEEPSPVLDAQAPVLEHQWKSQANPSFMSHRLLCFVLTATVGLGVAALWRGNAESSASTFLAAGNKPSAQPWLPQGQSLDQRPGSFRLENLHNRNRLSNF